MNIMRFNSYSINESKVIDIPGSGNFVVMAGGPGSGKSFITDNLLNMTNYKEFNVDKFRVFLAKKWWGENWKEMISTEDGYDAILSQSYTTSDPRNITIKFLKQFLKVERQGEIPNVVFDAGGGQVDVINVIHDLAKKAGYETSIVYVETDEKTALERNVKRDRSLPDDMVIDYRSRVEAGKKDLEALFDNVWYVYNTEHSALYSFEERPSDRIEKIK